ncbi:hypothetical protein K502DRAFT_332502 [Neoconidiobolus thromboides FSU 785]|nr:hypothetical protein K502DRAFT_332502 [Neoconidiobolus thromboides FSU 785]
MKEKRATRKKVKSSQNTDWSKVSASHYVGYVEDGESIEAIMKKFEELDRLKEEVTSKKSKVQEGEDSEPEVYGLANLFEPEPKVKSIPSEIKENVELSQEQLEELFVRTSVFTLESAAEQLDPLSEWWQIQDSEYNSEIDMDDDYMDYGDDEWEEEISSKTKRSKSSKGTRGGVKDRSKQRELVMRRYKENQLQDSSGNMLAMLKKVQLTDPSLPTYVKIPPAPIPLSWARRITPLFRPKEEARKLSFKIDILNEFDKIKKLGNEFQAILMDPPLLLDDEEMSFNTSQSHRKPIRMKEFKKLRIPEIIKCGFLMIWIEKHHLSEILKQCIEGWKFRYVENVAWVHYNLDNTIHKKDSKIPPKLQDENGTKGYFKSSKTTLLIFRIGGDIDIRHQRSPDVIFDHTRPSLDEDPFNIYKACNHQPKFIYDLIETLLPIPVGHKHNQSPFRFLELWASPSRFKTATTPWISIVNQEQSAEDIE